MSLDSRDKRASAINPASPWRSMWVLADGDLAQAEDRRFLAFLSVSVAGGGAPAAAGSDWLIRVRRRTLRR